MTDDISQKTVSEISDEIDHLRLKHGTMKACLVFIKRYTDARSWLRFGLFVLSGVLIYSGLDGLQIPVTALTTQTIGSTEAGVWTIFIMAVLFGVWKGLDHVLT